MTGPVALGGSTSAGLPYPGPADAMCETDRFIRELAQAIDSRLSSTGWAYWTGGMTTNTNGDIALDWRATLASVYGVRVQSGTPGNPLAESVLWQIIDGAPVGVSWVRCLNPTNLGALPNRFTIISVLAWGTPL